MRLRFEQGFCPILSSTSLNASCVVRAPRAPCTPPFLPLIPSISSRYDPEVRARGTFRRTERLVAASPFETQRQTRKDVMDANTALVGR
jgi:hypothetical protein